MGQQQILLILLALVIVGIAVAIGINLFTANSASTKRDVITNEGVMLASLAQEYYRKPIMFGGGDRSFNNWKFPNKLKNTPNGSFTADISDQKVVITCVGNEIISNGDSVRVSVTVYPSTYVTEVIR